MSDTDQYLKDRSASFGRGFDLGAHVVQRSVEYDLVQYILAVLGKDRSDGEIDLGVLGKHYVGEARV